MINKLKELPRWSALLAFVAVFAVAAFVVGCGPSDSEEPGDESSSVGTDDSGASGSAVADEHDEDEDDEDGDGHDEDGGHGDDEGSNVSADSFGDVAAVWGEVVAKKAELDGVIASKKLLDVHKAAFAVRDLIKLLPDMSHDLSDDAQADLAKGVGSVVSIAAELDKAGDSEKQEETEAANARFQIVLDAIEPIYPEGALK